MKHQINRLFIVILMIIIGYSSINFGYDIKIDLENSYTKRIQSLMDGVYGPRNILVSTEIQIYPPKYEVKYTEQSKPKVAKKKKTSQKEYQLLPGYPVIKNLGPSGYNNLPFDSVTKYIEPKIKNITINLVVNKSFPKSQLGKAQALIKKVLKMKNGRDKINITFQKFLPLNANTVNTNVLEGTHSFFTLHNIFVLSGLGLLLLFLITYIIFQIIGLRTQSQAEGKGGGGQGPNINVSPNIELPKGNGGGSGGSGNLKLSKSEPVKVYFDFVDDSNIEKLIYIINNEKISFENIALMISFLRPDLAAQLLTRLEEKDQITATLDLLNQRMIQRQQVEKFENQIKQALECLTGGPNIFKSIFDNISNDAKKRILSTVGESHPDQYPLIRNNLTLFDDIKHLSDDELKILLSEARVELLATALANVDQELYQRIDQNLTKTAKDMIAQFLELKGQNMSKAEIEQAQSQILEIVKRLEAKNKIQLQEKIQV